MRHEATANGRTGLAWDTAFKALSSGRRRRLLTLLDEEEETTISDIARRFVEEDASDEPDRNVRETVEIALHHVHLPTLQTAGLVEWDRADGTVSLATDVGRLSLFTSPSEPPVARRGAVTPAGCSDVE